MFWGSQKISRGGTLCKFVATCRQMYAKLRRNCFVLSRKGAQNCRKFVVNWKIHFGQIYGKCPFCNATFLQFLRLSEPLGPLGREPGQIVTSPGNLGTRKPTQTLSRTLRVMDVHAPKLVDVRTEKCVCVPVVPVMGTETF